MFSFFIGLAIALFIAIAGFGGFLFKLFNANKADMKSGAFSMPKSSGEPVPENNSPLSEIEADNFFNQTEEIPQEPNFNIGS